MESIDLSTFSLSKLREFKNIGGKFCFINPELIVDFPVSTVKYNVNFEENKPTLVVNFTNKYLVSFIESLKTKVIDLVYNKKIYNVPKETLSEFYVSPIKSFKNKDFIKLKLLHSELKTVSKGMRVKPKVHISGMWFAESSFGCYFNVLNLEIIENVKKPLFLEDSESEIEINV
jgi:hypothetical protein